MYSTPAAGFAAHGRPLLDLLRQPGWRSALPRWLALPLADMLAVLLATVGVLLLQSLAAPPSSVVPLVLVLVLALACAVGTVHLWLGLYDTAGHASLERLRLRVVGALVAPCLAITGLALLGHLEAEALPALAIGGLLAGLLGLSFEVLLRPLLIRHSAWGTQAILLGHGAATAGVVEALLRQSDLGLRPIGFVADAPPADGGMPVPYLGTVDEAARNLGGSPAVLIAVSPDCPPFEVANLPFRRIIAMPAGVNLPALRVKSRNLGGALGLEVANGAQASTHRRIKRAAELCIAVPMLLAAAPVIGILMVLIRLISPGPAIYVQPRVGHLGRTVSVLKLRTMHLNADVLLAELLARDPEARAEWDSHMKLAKDPRVLPWIGNFMRRSSLDELPQLWNVVRGDLSLVGPRPFPAYHVGRFNPEFQALRASVKPGLTGLWQVSDRSNADLARQEAIDSFYIRNWSLWLDLYIFLKTFPAVLSARGAR
jgi:Undecaprenyl-phosphate galactose phosphotransferase WbaP